MGKRKVDFFTENRLVWGFIPLLVLLSFTCRTSDNNRDDFLISKAGLEQPLRGPDQFMLQISPDGLSALVQGRRTDFFWYALPSGKVIRKGKNRNGRSLLGFSEQGLAWLRDDTVLVDVHADGSKQRIAAPEGGEQWLGMYVAANKGALAGLFQEQDTAILQIFAPLGEKNAVFTKRFPPAQQHWLLADHGMAILAVISRTKGSKADRIEFLRHSADGLEQLRVVEAAFTWPAMGHGKVAWAEKSGIKLMDSQGQVKTLAGNEMDQVGFFAEGTRLLATNAQAGADLAELNIKARVYAVLDQQLLRERDLKAPAGNKFFLGPQENLYAIRLNKAEQPVITAFSWQK
ncbi:MAG TPA: hypothetical protein ENJ82_00015 [Bacteroidetes bacterium]|nr:hypothetical protein [Bacteroidota bacterium]